VTGINDLFIKITTESALFAEKVIYVLQGSVVTLFK